VSNISSSDQRLPITCGPFLSDSPVLIPLIPQSAVVPAVNSCESDALFESDALTGGDYTWKAKLPAGTEAIIVVDDETGNEAWSGPVSL
jgi:hypothetical protein